MAENTDPVADAVEHLRLTLERWATAKRALTSFETEQIRTLALAVLAISVHGWVSKRNTIMVEAAEIEVTIPDYDAVKAEAAD